MCAFHDSEFFKKIDDAVLDISDHEQLFLYAYRSVITEQYKVSQTASKLQTAYVSKINAGKIRGDVETPEGLYATACIMNAYETFLYRLEYEDFFTQRKYSELDHVIISLSVAYNTIAASTLFSLDEYRNKKNETPRIAFNLIPMGADKCAFIASCLKVDYAYVKAYLSPILAAKDSYYQKYLISKMIIENCENFVISPKFFSKWSEDKKMTVKDYFEDTLNPSFKGRENEEFYLFE